jgi:phosphomannomutase
MNEHGTIGDKFKPLRFGTSGLRALVTDMTDLECSINTKGFVRFLTEQGEIKDGGSIALGGDLRSSTPRILAAVKKAIEDEGFEVDFCGAVPSPTLVLYAMAHGKPSIMVTGSHIPDDRNGIKFSKASGEVLKEDETPILRNVKSAREEAYATWEDAGLYREDGMFKQAEGLPQASDVALALYEKRYLDFFPGKPLAGKKIVFYQHSAVGRDLLPSILQGMGAEVVLAAHSDSFVPVDTEKVSEETIRLLAEMADKHKPFAVLSTDGDSDRPLFADERGRFLPGDKLGALAALYLRPDFVAVPVSTNDAVVKTLKKEGMRVAQTRIGSPYVIKAMMDRGQENPSDGLASWEANGGFLTGSDWTLDGKPLAALPTRDAFLPVVAAILLAGREGLSLSALIAKKLPSRSTNAGVIDNTSPGCEKYTASMGRQIIATFSPADPSLSQVDYSPSAVTVTKGLETSPASSAARKELFEIKEVIGKYFSAEYGFAEIESVNFIDGIRIGFADGNIAHMRPSGNAPEFRIYAEADTLEKAMDIVEKKDQVIPKIIAGMT